MNILLKLVIWSVFRIDYLFAKAQAIILISFSHHSNLIEWEKIKKRKIPNFKKFQKSIKYAYYIINCCLNPFWLLKDDQKCRDKHNKALFFMLTFTWKWAIQPYFTKLQSSGATNPYMRCSDIFSYKPLSVACCLTLNFGKWHKAGNFHQFFDGIVQS